MRLFSLIVAAAICGYAPSVSIASPAVPESAVIVAAAPGHATGSLIDGGKRYDPYFGQGGLRTKPVPVCCCSTHDAVCESAELGAQCKLPLNPACVCVAFGACRVP